MRRGLAAISALTFLALACSSIENFLRPDAPVPVAAAGTVSPAVMATPAFTAALTPSPTACIPSPNLPAALQSAQKRIDDLVPGAQVTWYDDFVCEDWSYGWTWRKNNSTMTIDIADSVMTVSADLIPDVYDGPGRAAETLADNKGMLMSFQYYGNSIINLFIITGDWLSSDCRRWGLSINNGSFRKTLWEGWEAKQWFGGDFPDGALQPDVWYYLLIRLGDAGQVMMKVWDKENPANQTDFQQSMGAAWVGRQWSSLFQIYDGTLEIDEYWEFEL